MRRKMVIIIIVLVSLIFIGAGMVIIKLSTKGENITQSKLNDNFEKIEKETNEITQEELQNEIEIAYIDNSEIQNTVQKEVIIEKKQKNTTNESSKSHTQEKTSENIISNTNKEKEIISVSNNHEANNKKTQEVKENVSNNNVLNENTKKEEDKNTSLANTTYRKVNTEVLPEIKKLLEDEIKKEKELVDFGTTVITTNKSNAFTYMFVNEIEKGKTEGNYVKFEQRVKNTVGAFGKYYIYAEDEFVYNSEGKNPKWSQTLVWIYVRF